MYTYMYMYIWWNLRVLFGGTSGSLRVLLVEPLVVYVVEPLVVYVYYLVEPLVVYVYYLVEPLVVYVYIWWNLW